MSKGRKGLAVWPEGRVRMGVGSDASVIIVFAADGRVGPGVVGGGIFGGLKRWSLNLVLILGFVGDN